MDNRKRNKIGTIIMSIISIFSIVLALGNMNIIISSFADDDGVQDIINKTNGYNTNEKDSLFNKLFADDSSETKGKTDNIASVLSYLFKPGHYMYDISKASIADDNDEKADNTTIERNGDVITVCPSSPQNLISHNCDLPALGTAFYQSIASDSTGIINGERTSAISLFGIPNGIPEDIVPIKDTDRKYKYTALELFGYNLQYTSYAGEWDNIQVSTSARLLSNFGYWDKAKLTGTAAWHTITSGFKAATTQFSWDPIQYWSNIANAAAAGAMWTVVDTSDYNVVSQHSWLRPEFAKTVYNAYYLSSKEINDKLSADLIEILKVYLKGTDEKVVNLKNADITKDDFPKFKYNSKVVTGQDDTGNPTYQSEEEQLKAWLESADMASIMASGNSIGIDCSTSTGSYGSWKACWEEQWVKKVFEEISDENSSSHVENKKIENILKDLKESHKYDPTRSIGHWVCANEEGVPTSTILQEMKYLYSKENNNDTEYFNSSCHAVRPTIKGGYFGTGDNLTGLADFVNIFDKSASKKLKDKQIDTRWAQFIQNKGTNFAQNNVSSSSGFYKFLAITATQITNTFINLTYSNLLEELGLTKIFEILIVEFRDSLFFPLASVAIAISAVYECMKVIRRGSTVTTIQTLILIVLIFLFGVLIMNSPANMMKLVEEIPNKIDNAIAGIILKEPDSKDDVLCSATGGEKDNIRTLQCKIWQINIFTPWVYGQWNTNYQNLEVSNFSNTNVDLVGKGTVRMGGGVKTNNWAIFQLEKTKSGTINAVDTTNTTGQTSKALYKLVDLQFGPNNGAQSDDKYAAYWSGVKGSRAGYTFKSMIVSILIMIPFVAMGLAKIELTLLFAMFLVFLPFMFLRGLLPNGKANLQKYFAKMINIFVKRCMITFLISFSAFFIVTVTNTAASDYNVIFLFTIIFALALKVYYKELINLFSISSEATSSFISDNVGGLREQISQSRLLPEQLAWKTRMAALGARDAVIGGATGGAIGVIESIKDNSARREFGYRRTTKSPITGNTYRTNAILEGIKSGAKGGLRRSNLKIFNDERRRGLPTFELIKKAKEAGELSVGNKYHKDRLNNNLTGVEAKNIIYVNNLQTVLTSELIELSVLSEAKVQRFNNANNALYQKAKERGYIDKDNKIKFDDYKDMEFYNEFNHVQDLYDDALKTAYNFQRTQEAKDFISNVENKDFKINKDEYNIISNYTHNININPSEKPVLKDVTDVNKEALEIFKDDVQALEKKEDTKVLHKLYEWGENIKEGTYITVDNTIRTKARLDSKNINKANLSELEKSALDKDLLSNKEDFVHNRNIKEVRAENIDSKVFVNSIDKKIDIHDEHVIRNKQDINEMIYELNPSSETIIKNKQEKNINEFKNELDELINTKKSSNEDVKELEEFKPILQNQIIPEMKNIIEDKDVWDEKQVRKEIELISGMKNKYDEKISETDGIIKNITNDYIKDGLSLYAAEENRDENLLFLDEKKYNKDIENKNTLGKYLKTDDNLILDIDNYNQKNAKKELDIQKINKQMLIKKAAINGANKSTLSRLLEIQLFMNSLEKISDGNKSKDKNFKRAEKGWNAVKRSSKSNNINKINYNNFKKKHINNEKLEKDIIKNLLR